MISSLFGGLLQQGNLSSNTRSRGRSGSRARPSSRCTGRLNRSIIIEKTAMLQKFSLNLTAEPAGHNLGPHRPAVGLVLAETGAGTASEMIQKAVSHKL